MNFALGKHDQLFFSPLPPAAPAPVPNGAAGVTELETQASSTHYFNERRRPLLLSPSPDAAEHLCYKYTCERMCVTGLEAMCDDDNKITSVMQKSLELRTVKQILS